MRARALIPVLAVAVAQSGCGEETPARRDAAIPVVATTTHVADLVRRVGANRVGVRRLLEPDSDPHDYEPRPSDARAVAEAKLVFKSGGEVDEWLGDVVEAAGGDAATVTLINHVRTMPRAKGDEIDPHWWQDPRNGLRAVEAIRKALIRADPRGRPIYSRNAAAYARRLRQLDRAIADCIERVPRARRKLVTTHDALGYYAERYGIETIGALVPSVSTQAQPSARETERLVRQIRKEGVDAIFPESALNPKLERAVARESGAEVGRALWADSLGPPGSDGATYLTAMASNTAALVEGLTGGARSCRPLS